MTTRNFGSLMNDCNQAISDLAKWPDKMTVCEDANAITRQMAKAIKEENYTSYVTDGILLNIAANALWEARLRGGVNAKGLRAAWVLLAELIV